MRAAEAELAENGIESFSLRAVAKRAGVSHGAPAHHFKDAKGLLTALAASAVGDTVRLGVGGVADKPNVREWTGLADSDLDDALNAFAWDLGGYDDIHATSKYRRKLVRKLGRRVIEEAKSCQS